MTLFPCICADYFVFVIPDYQFQKALMISYFLFQIISLKKYFCFVIIFSGSPLAVEAPGQLPSLPPLKSGRGYVSQSQANSAYNNLSNGIGDVYWQKAVEFLFGWKCEL